MQFKLYFNTSKAFFFFNLFLQLISSVQMFVYTSSTTPNIKWISKE
jgi:hypothetical protein